MEPIEKEVLIFFLVLLRVGLVLAFLPFFGSPQLPNIFKVGLVVGLSLIITPLVDVSVRTDHIFGLVAKEMLMSVAMAMIVRLVFFGIDVAGQIMSTTMGLSIATVFNPEIGQSTELARFYSILTMLMFFSLNLHHQIIYALVESFHYIPAGGFHSDSFALPVVSLIGRLFVFGIKVSMPVVLVMMILNIVLGMLYKVIPQFNPFFVGYPLYIGVGLLVVLLGLPFFMTFLNGLFREGLNNLSEFILTGGH